MDLIAALRARLLRFTVRRVARSAPERVAAGSLQNLLATFVLALAWVPASASLLPSITSDWRVDDTPWLGPFPTAEEACKAREQYNHAIGERPKFTFERVVAGYNYGIDPVVMWCTGKHLDMVTGEVSTRLGYRITPTSAVCPASSSPVTNFPTSACQCANGYDGNTASGTCIYVPPPEPPQGGQCAADGQYAGNPIAMATAEKFQSEQDFLDGGPAPLSFTRSYRSNWSTASAHADAGLGIGWTHNHVMVLKADSGTAATEVKIVSPEGYARSFVKAGATWSASSGADTLVRNDSGRWTYKRSDNDTTYTFDAAGRLLAAMQRNGWTHAYSYGEAGRLASISNPFGRVLSFAYNSASQLTSVTTPDGRRIAYAFDGAGRLAAVTYPDGRSRRFVYENASFPQALTGVFDETGVRFATFGYDHAGLAISTERAGGVERYRGSSTHLWGALRSLPIPWAPCASIDMARVRESWR